MDENPFKTLGFHPRAFKDLHDEEIFTLVKAQYRALMQVHHPDVSKRRTAHDRSQSISNAFGQLNYEANPSLFEYWKNSFMKSERRKSKDVSLEEKFFRERERGLQKTISSYLKELYGSKPQEGEKNGMLPIPLSVITAQKGCALLLHDTYRVQSFAERGASHALGKARRQIRNVHDESVFDAGVVEVEIDKSGTLTFRGVMLRKLLKIDPEPDPFHSWVYRNAHHVGHYWTTLPEVRRKFQGRIIGSFDRERIKPIWHEGGEQVERKMIAGLHAGEISVIESRGLVTSQVEPYFWLLEPRLQRGHIVVCMSPEADKFIFLGELIMAASKTKAP